MGAIVGGAVARALVHAATVIACFYCWRRRLQQRQQRVALSPWQTAPRAETGWESWRSLTPGESAPVFTLPPFSNFFAILPPCTTKIPF